MEPLLVFVGVFSGLVSSTPPDRDVAADVRQTCAIRV
jgi:hypothetical protein